MPAIVEFPTIVQELLIQYGDVFGTEAARHHFAEYVTGLYIAERKTVSGINREFAQTTDQSCLNRWLTTVDWDVQALNQRRLALLQHEPSTRYTAHGVIAIDNTLIDHDGTLIADAGWFWDHADKRHLIAHDYLIVNYVCHSGKHYPLEFRRFRKRTTCTVERTTFKNHTQLCMELIDWVVDAEIPGEFTFDSYFTNADILNRIRHHQRAYVGDLKMNRMLTVDGHDIKASDWIKTRLGPSVRTKTMHGDTAQWFFSKTVRIPGVDHPVRVLVLWNNRDDKEPRKLLVTNRTWWEANRILKTYRKRWTGTETFHRDGKQHLGMGDCQLRNGEGQTRHMYLVFLAYSALMSQLQHDRANDWAHTRLTTIGETCRAILRETLGKTIAWVVDQVHAGLCIGDIKQKLALP